MGKRLNRSDYFIVYMIIISLACLVGGFFLGICVMKSKAQAEIEAITKDYTIKLNQDQMEKTKKLYKEEDFVSFYYNVFAPLEKFKQSHLTFQNKVANSSAGDYKSILSAAQDQANETLKKIEQANVSNSSPLLIQAKQEYMKSLQVYMDGMNQMNDGDTTKLTPQEMSQHLESFKRNWLRAQADFYKAIAIWEEMYVTNKPLVQQVSQSNISIEQWKSYPFNLRDYLAAENLYRNNVMVPFQPEDITARIDGVVLTNQASSLGWKDIPFAFRVLFTTDAVRPGDFKSLKNKLYPGFKSPELQFFNE
ncbi:hypothetical protein ACQCN2_04075 [Brevibacillus ginsengisoli]|uniref:hypothetical protein n=1 Tax=Brevibacillus ginsengisoli TaxID=363854 RepID=UPI003CE98851